jgi:hypothetical protein
MKAITNLKVQTYWESLVKEHEQSGLGVEAFCVKRAICSTSFYARRKQLRLMANPERQSGFIQFLERHTPVSDKNLASPMKISLKPGDRQVALPVRIQTPNGYSVEAVINGLKGLTDIFGMLKGL